MEKPKKIPAQPERGFEIRDPKLPVIRGGVPHNQAHDRINPRPTQQVDIDPTI